MVVIIIKLKKSHTGGNAAHCLQWRRFCCVLAPVFSFVLLCPCLEPLTGMSLHNLLQKPSEHQQEHRKKYGYGYQGLCHGHADEPAYKDSDIKRYHHGVSRIGPAAQPQHTVPLVRLIYFPFFL